MKLVYKGWPMTFELAPGEFRVLLGSFTLRRIEATDIEWVREGRSWWCEHYTNFGPPGSGSVTIRRKTGWFKNLVVNPIECGRFVEEMRQLYGLPAAPFA
jgi:hypothetical protein